MARHKQDLAKVTIRLHQGDKEELDEFYPAQGHNVIIRHLVHTHLKMLREKVNQKRSQTNDPIELDDIAITLE